MRVLVLSGGSSKGAFAAGAIQHLLGDLQIPYDVYCGVSSGAINAAFLAQYSVGQEKEASQTLCQLWQGITSRDVYRDWYLLGILQTIWRNSLLNSAPMRRLISQHISLERIRQSGRLVSVGAVSLQSGKYRTFTQADDDFVQSVQASCAFPVIFESVQIRGEQWVDGGNKSVSPLHTAIDMGADSIDVIMTSPVTRDKRFIAHPNTLDIVARSFDLFTEKIMSSDIEKALLYNRLAALGGTDRKAIKLRIIRPPCNLTDDLLDFDPAKIRDMMAVGYEEARTVMVGE